MKAIFSLPTVTINYLKDVVRELKRVEWLTAGEVAQYTMAVLLLTIFVGLFILSLDNVFVSIRSFLFTI